MKILYGVQGTGNGHIARARLMAEAFAQRTDAQVDYLFSGRDASAYFDMEVFGDYQTRRGLSFVTENGSLSRLKTVKNIRLVEFMRDVRKLDLGAYDLILNDFEPISAWAAKRQNIPSLSISHQAAFIYPVPTEAQSTIDKWVTQYFAPTRYALGVHWYHYNQAIIPPFVPPLISPSMPKTSSMQNIDPQGRPKKSDFTLVYLPFEDTNQIQQVLQALSENSFYCYHPDVEVPFVEKNIHWFPPSKIGFHEALSSCKQVIANGGFELATECLSLGKALLMKPLTGQFEQFSNAFMLRQLGVSDTLFNLNTDDIEEWLNNHNATKIRFPDNVNGFIDWIIAGDLSDTATICRQLWQQVEFPDEVGEKLRTTSRINI
jgi:uncharacterized protein (TIGR00661 family)